MTPQELKNSILQLAIQGKLVEQCPEEGTAEELYRQIQAEKQKLIKEGKIKKERPLPEITEEEKTFDIPDSWKLFRLGELITLLSGTDFPPERYNDKGLGTPYITGASSLHENGVLLNRWTETPSIIAESGDVLLVCKGSGYGKTVICDIVEAHIARQIMAIKHSTLLDMNYIRYFLQANLTTIKAYGQGVIPGIDRSSVLNMAIPLPPLAEQKRIVAKLEELLSLIERYDKAWNCLEDFNKRFPPDMKKSILQFAIQGKLVEQRPEEGTGEELYQQIQAEKQALIKAGKIKKEKPFSTSTIYNEYPFEIPESWIFVRLGDLMISRDSERIPVSTAEREHRNKIYDYYGASGVIDKIDDYIFDKKLLLIGEDGANLLTRSSPIAFLANGKYWVNNHAHVLDGCAGLYLEYICYFEITF